VSHCRVGTAGQDCDVIDVDSAWGDVYGVGADGAVLVRPDGHVSWRAFAGPDAHVGVGVVEALEIALGRRLPQGEDS
jgi:putative polyketide hydroxylase